MLHDLYNNRSFVLHDLYNNRSFVLHDLHNNISFVLHDLYNNISFVLHDLHNNRSFVLCHLHNNRSFVLHDLHNNRYFETWKSKINNGCKVSALVMDLSKAFDTLNHNLLIAKLDAYGFDENSLLFVKSYLSNNRFQRSKIGDSFSLRRQIITGVPQSSILGPLLFNIFINDIFLFAVKASLCNYADDNTLYAFDK